MPFFTLNSPKVLAKCSTWTMLPGAWSRWRSNLQSSLLPQIEFSWRVSWRRDSSNNFCSVPGTSLRGEGSLSCNCLGLSLPLRYVCTDFSAIENWTTGTNSGLYQPTSTTFDVWWVSDLLCFLSLVLPLALNHFQINVISFYCIASTGVFLDDLLCLHSYILTNHTLLMLSKEKEKNVCWAKEYTSKGTDSKRFLIDNQMSAIYLYKYLHIKCPYWRDPQDGMQVEDEYKIRKNTRHHCMYPYFVFILYLYVFTYCLN